MAKPEIRLAFMKALADTKDKSVSAKAYLVKRLWRSTDPEIKQAARVALNTFKSEIKQPKGVAVARLVRDRLAERYPDGRDPDQGVLKEIYGIVAHLTRLRDRTVKEYYEDFRRTIPEIEAREREALTQRLEAEAKSGRDSLFYQNAANWEEQQE